jgi:hypothetical protein
MHLLVVYLPYICDIAMHCDVYVHMYANSLALIDAHKHSTPIFTVKHRLFLLRQWDHAAAQRQTVTHSY